MDLDWYAWTFFATCGAIAAFACWRVYLDEKWWKAEQAKRVSQGPVPAAPVEPVLWSCDGLCRMSPETRQHLESIRRRGERRCAEEQRDADEVCRILGIEHGTIDEMYGTMIAAGGDVQHVIQKILDHRCVGA